MAVANKIEQVFLNIFNNAMDAMDEAAGEHGKLLKIRSFTEEDQVFVTISDTGGGIPEHAREKIFEPFKIKPIICSFIFLLTNVRRQ